MVHQRQGKTRVTKLRRKDVPHTTFPINHSFNLAGLITCCLMTAKACQADIRHHEERKSDAAHCVGVACCPRRCSEGLPAMGTHW
jgi:hypothetical protein